MAPSKLNASVADYFKTNLWVTTSGYFSAPPFQCAREVLGMDRLMFSVDYPFSPNTNGRKFLDLIAPTLSEGEMEALTHGNAERVLGLRKA